MKKNSVFILFSSFILSSFFIFTSCEKSEVLSAKSSSLSDGMISTIDVSAYEGLFSGNHNPGKLTVVGGVKNNPYTIEQMTSAFNSLAQKEPSLDISSLKVRHTHTYFRILPSTWDEYDFIIRNNKSIDFFDRPLDRDVLVPGDYYQDPNISLGNPTWLYSVVTKDFPINVKSEIENLAFLYLPEQDQEIRDERLVLKIVNEAFLLLGYEKEIVDLNNRAGYTPSGTIRVKDTQTNLYTPVVGIKVRMLQWFNIYSRKTDGNGFFTMGQVFNNAVNYNLIYEDEHFDIRSGAWGQAKYDGPKINAPFNLDINDDPQKLFAHVFKATRKYYTEFGSFGIQIPPTNLNDIKIGAYNCLDINDDGSYVGGDYQSWRNWLTRPDIRIYNAELAPSRTSMNTFSTTIHEIAHASHWKLPGTFSGVKDQVSESWARCVQWSITSQHYGINWNDGLSWLTSTNPNMKKGYTPLFIDLIDNHNQGGGNITDKADDRVTGFTLSNLENSVISNSKTFADCKTKIKNLNIASNSNIDLLFDFYITTLSFQ